MTEKETSDVSRLIARLKEVARGFEENGSYYSHKAACELCAIADQLTLLSSQQLEEENARPNDAEKPSVDAARAASPHFTVFADYVIGGWERDAEAASLSATVAEALEASPVAEATVIHYDTGHSERPRADRHVVSSGPSGRETALEKRIADLEWQGHTLAEQLLKADAEVARLSSSLRETTEKIANIPVFDRCAGYRAAVLEILRARAALPQKDGVILTECCGVEIFADWRFCPACGYEARVMTRPSAAEKPKIDETRGRSPQRSGWQPIDTAPKDGGQFVALWSDGRCDMMGGWAEYEEILGYGEKPATHWLPLPAPPEAP